MSSIGQLNYAANIIGSYLSLICFILGIIGLSLNCILLTQRIFRNNPCAAYFLASTYANIIVLLINNLFSVLQLFDNFQIASVNIVLCKIQRYLSWMSRSLSVWLIVLATIDRFLNSFSDINIRSWSSIKIVKRSIRIITITMMIIYVHMLIFYQLFYTTDSNGNVSSICNPKTGFYAIFTSLLHTAIYSCLPIILMFIFGMLTLININRQRRIIVPVNINDRRFQQSTRLNNQLVKMLIIQILIISITTFPLSVQRVYAAFTTNVSKSSYRIAQENLFSQIAQGFSYLAHTTSFYLFTLTGYIFRKELKRLFIRFINYFHGINNRLMPNNSINTIPVRTQMQKHQSQLQQFPITSNKNIQQEI